MDWLRFSNHLGSIKTNGARNLIDPCLIEICFCQRDATTAFREIAEGGVLPHFAAPFPEQIRPINRNRKTGFYCDLKRSTKKNGARIPFHKSPCWKLSYFFYDSNSFLGFDWIECWLVGLWPHSHNLVNL